MNPAQIALTNMYFVLKVAAGLFVIRLGLEIFGGGRYVKFIDIFAFSALALMVISSLTGFMSAANTISQGSWPK